ncbi:MAG: hypothetical protein WDZ50_07505 [Woeseia sp.]
MIDPDENKHAASDDPLAADAARRFDESVQRLDAATLSRLNRSRQAALTELAGRTAVRRWHRWIPAAAVATAAAFTVLMLNDPSVIDAIPSYDAAADFEVIMAGENLEMLEELEFYRWLYADAETEIAPAPDDHVG